MSRRNLAPLVFLFFTSDEFLIRLFFSLFKCVSFPFVIYFLFIYPDFCVLFRYKIFFSRNKTHMNVAVRVCFIVSTLPTFFLLKYILVPVHVFFVTSPCNLKIPGSISENYQ